MMLLVLTFLTVMMTNLLIIKIVSTLLAATHMVVIFLLMVLKCHQMKGHTPVEMSDLSSDPDTVIDYTRDTNMIPCEEGKIYADDSDKMQTKHKQSETK